MTIILPTTCTVQTPFIPLPTTTPADSKPIHTVSEAIALKLRRPNTSHAYLYPQIFAGLSYLLASLCMLELSRVLRKKRNLARNASETTLAPVLEQDVLEEDEKARPAALQLDCRCGVRVLPTPKT